MCGIVTQFSRNGRTVKEESLWRATHELHHRGPDGHRIWLAPHGRVGMGHARLSIIDLETGDQPLANEDGQIHAVVNASQVFATTASAYARARTPRVKPRAKPRIRCQIEAAISRS